MATISRSHRSKAICTYFYIVTAIVGGIESGASAQASATPLLVPPAPIAAAAADRQITLTWTAQPGVDGYDACFSTTAGVPETGAKHVLLRAHRDRCRHRVDTVHRGERDRARPDAGQRHG